MGQRNRDDVLRTAVGDHRKRVVQEILFPEVALRCAGGAVTAPIQCEHAASRTEQVAHAIEGRSRSAPAGHEEQGRVAEPLVVVVDDHVVRSHPGHDRLDG
jgi:hypothetical protein